MKRDALGDFLRDLGGLYRAQQVYPVGNQQVQRAAEKAVESLTRVGHLVRIARLGSDVVAEERTLQSPPAALCSLLDQLSQSGCEGLQIALGVTPAELVHWVEMLVSGEMTKADCPHILVGTFRLDAPSPTEGGAYAEVAAGYLSLTPGVQEALAELSGQNPHGLGRAREIVRSIAGHMAAGEGLFNPIRNLKSHHDYTFTHALNVCVISAAVAREAGLGEREVDRISLAALCHDIGKEKVPAEILNKDGPLTEEEKLVMDRHPIQGAQLLLSLHESVDPLLPVVAFEHHRGADGSGYPHYPRFERVHPASMIVAVADTYDALRTVRSYQQPHSTAQAVNIMLARGHQGVLAWRFLGAFVRSLGLLDVGRRVTLNDGRRARIVAVTSIDPFAPWVETEDGQPLQVAGPSGPFIEAVHDESLT